MQELGAALGRVQSVAMASAANRLCCWGGLLTLIVSDRKLQKVSTTKLLRRTDATRLVVVNATRQLPLPVAWRYTDASHRHTQSAPRTHTLESQVIPMESNSIAYLIYST